MITSQAKTQFETVLKKEQLLDVKAIFDGDCFHEVPLYSRYKQVEFLKEYGDVNLLLLELALDYLGRVASETYKGKANRFIAITISEDDDYIIPSIFVCNGKVKTRLKKLNFLTLPSEGIGKQIEDSLRKANLHNAFDVLEDRNTVPGNVRVFITYKQAIIKTKTIAEIVEKYPSGYWTSSEFGIQLMKFLTKEQLPDLLKLTPSSTLDELKKSALSGKWITVMWMGSGRGHTEAMDKATEEFNRGLGILREYLVENHA